MKGRIQLLRAEIQSDRRAFAERIAELSALELKHSSAIEGDMARVAVALHHAYGAVESALARVARVVDSSEPSGIDWHHGLLTQMALDLPEERPAILSAESVSLLRALLAFRYFFRHGYAVKLDRDRLMVVREHALRVKPLLDRDLDRLDAFLGSLSERAP